MKDRAVSSFRRTCLVATLICATFALAQRETAPKLVARLGQIMQAHAADGDFSGTVLIAHESSIVYQHAFGYANLEWKIPNDLQTKFEIGSITKQFTALLVLQFVNEGRIKLDRHLSDYLPYYRKDTGNRITVRQLLSHTSGIPNFLSVRGFLDGRPAEQGTG